MRKPSFKLPHIKLPHITRSQAKHAAKTTAAAAGDLFALILRAMGAVLLIVVTTATLFACIFVIYVKTNLTGGLDISLEEYQMNLSSTFYCIDDNGVKQEVATLQSSEYRVWADYDEIPEFMRNAIVAIEDKRFYEHHGVDWYRTVAAFTNMFIGMRDNFGGSTITQQLLKNLTGEDQATVTRKLQEIFRALEFEQRYGKDDIITWYLNEVNFGGSVYGVAAAADYYFGKSLDELTLAECASIVGITNNPSRYNPYISRENNKTRQENILNEMYQQGYISHEEMSAAQAQELVFKRGENSKYTPVIYPWFVESAISDVVTDLAALRGITRSEAERALYRGGYSIMLTMNPRIQAAMDQIYTDLSQIPVTTGTPKQLQSAMVIMDPYNGYIVGIVGGVGEKTVNLGLNRATSDLGRRPVGSSIKPIAVYSLAMENGLITPETMVDDAPMELSEAAKGWYPLNDDHDYIGLINIRTALAKSRNTISAQLLDKVTPAVAYRFMTQTLGFDLDPRDEDYAPMAVGQLTVGATPREMASAYTMFPNGGVRTEGITYTTVTDNDGNIIIDNRPVRQIAVSETTAYWMTDIMRSALQWGSGTGANLGDMPAAGKTGTTTNNKDRYFVGFTPYYVAAVWSGYDAPEHIYCAAGSPSVILFKKVMSIVHSDESITPIKQFRVPENTSQTPVPGIRVVDYTVRYVSGGEVIDTETSQGRVGTEITVKARDFDGYTPIGATTRQVTLSGIASENVFTFEYIDDNYVPPTPEIPDHPEYNPEYPEYPDYPNYTDHPDYFMVGTR
ncbi:MAG: transglycosylase domain-containing protein [Oscillospiraceae bacterium]|nr:transglycosylase domain-containing protein [Oscillospiraceae bacterium]